MTNLFLMIVNMSMTASYVAIAVMAVRLLLRRAPKIFSYTLWSAVLIRLIFPVSFISSFSFLRLIQPRDSGGAGLLEFVPSDIGLQLQPAVDVGVRGASRLVNGSLPAATPLASVNPMQIIIWAASMIWIAGVVILLLYSVVSYLRIQARVRTATLVRDHIFETDRIGAPFVFGFVKPKIYIPTGLGEQEQSYIVEHEQTHIRGRDHLIKPIAFLVLIIHWFNPLIWVSYRLMSKDMEMSCDEAVVKRMGSRIVKGYSSLLLALSMRRSVPLTAGPLAFGESHVKARIKNIVRYRHPSPWVAAGSMLAIVLLVIGCTANPKPLQPSPTYYSGYNMDALMANKTLYIGNHSRVGGLIGGMPRPEGLEGNGIALQTAAPPYGLTIHYKMNDSAGVTRDGAISGEALYRNAVLLFSLIDNVDIITFSIADNTGQHDGASYHFTFTRDEIRERLGEDVRRYSADEASLRQLIDRVNPLLLEEPPRPEGP